MAHYGMAFISSIRSVSAVRFGEAVAFSAKTFILAGLDSAFSEMPPLVQVIYLIAAERATLISKRSDVKDLVDSGRKFWQYERRRRYDATLGGRHGHHPWDP